MPMKFDTTPGNKENARELADMVGSIVADEELPLEVLELTADILKEDVRQIKEAAVGIMAEERALHGKEGENGGQDGKARDSIPQCKQVQVSQYRVAYCGDYSNWRYNLLRVL